MKVAIKSKSGDVERIVVTPMPYLNVPDNNRHRVFADIKLVKGRILIKANRELKDAGRFNYFIEFGNRITAQMQHQARELIAKEQLFDFLFPRSSIRNESLRFIPKLAWKSDSLNAEQKKAVEGVLTHPLNKAPYIIMGPPVTGKTKTIVEAIFQILVTDTRSSVLVCATSNAACNEICSRLLQIMHESLVFRMYSQKKAEDLDSIPDEIVQVSNLSTKYRAKYKSAQLPCLADLCKYRVVVGTLVMAGRLAQADIDKKHFNYVFLDECGSTTEANAVIAIAGVCTSYWRVNAGFIIAGDPKQLGPVVKSKCASFCGLGSFAISLSRHRISIIVFRKVLA